MSTMSGERRDQSGFAGWLYTLSTLAVWLWVGALVLAFWFAVVMIVRWVA